MSGTAYRALSLILFLLGIFGILFTSTEAIIWSRDGTYFSAILFGSLTAICFWTSGIFFERGFLAGNHTASVVRDWDTPEYEYETQTPDSIMPKSIANIPPRRKRLVD